MTEESLFHQVLSQAPPERAAFLEQACAGKPELRAAVEAMLLAHAKAGNVAEQAQEDLDRAAHSTFTATAASGTGEHSPSPLVETADYFPSPRPGAVIAGRYTLVDKLGEGGMGEVWVAKQSEPVKRKVALKLIKAGMDSRAVIQRFEQERQALALMEHPHIAKVLDGGLTADRRPFFVMELVGGLPLTQFCDQAKLGIRERLALFVPICQAVQHAHQKGIIHRDLKPSNILVANIDGRGVPKIIDFGVAKATSGRLTEESLSTQLGAIVGTLEYMSPEQAGVEEADVDTRADIYSLGVILYELLTGLRPLDVTRRKRAALPEILRVIKEQEPAKPSTQLSTHDSAATLAALRQTEPKKLAALLRGELDWVVMKCLEKSRDRRYDTANSLARDIQRFLADEPVEARPPSTGYRLRKFVQRHRGQVIAAGLVLAVLVSGIAGTTWGLIRARQANAELADEQAKVQARFELAQKAIATFHTGVSEDALLRNDQFKELRTKLLKEAATFYGDLEKLLEGQTDARSRKLLAEGYFQLGELTEKIGSQPEALAVHRKALAVRRELADQPGADVASRLDVARSLLAVGNLQAATGDLPGATATYEEHRALVEALAAEAPSEEIRAARAYNHTRFGILWAKSGKPEEALKEHEKARAIFQELADANPTGSQFQTDLANSHHNIGNLLRNTGKLEQAIQEHKKARTIRQQLADANKSDIRLLRGLAASYNDLGNLLMDDSKLEQALTAYEQGRGIHQRLADANPSVTSLQSELSDADHNIGLLLWRMDRPKDALKALIQARDIRQKLADANPAVTELQSDLAWSHYNIGALLPRAEDPTEALKEFEAARDIQQKLTQTNPTVTDFQLGLALSHTAIGVLQKEAGKSAEALKAFEKARDIEHKLVEANPTVHLYQNYLAVTQNNVGDLLVQMDRPAEALTAYEKARDIGKKLTETHPTNSDYQRELLAIDNNLGRQYARQKRLSEAFATLDAALAIGQRLSDASPSIAIFKSNRATSHAYRGWARLQAGQPMEAAADLRQAVKLWAKVNDLTDEARFERVRVLALLAGLAADATAGVSAAEAQDFADKAVAALRDAITAGWKQSTELKEPDFDALRDRADFKKLVAELEKKAATKAPKKP